MAFPLVNDFFRWWASELAGMMPRPPRSRRTSRAAYLLFELSHEQVDVYHVVRGRKQELGREPAVSSEKAVDTEGAPQAPVADALSVILAGYRPDKTAVVAEVPSDQVLTKRIELPMAAEETMHQVLSFEMERQTPFRADAVYFDHEVVERNATQQTIEVELRVVPRQFIDPALAVLADWNLTPTDIIHQADSGTFSVRFVSSRYKGAGSPRVLAMLVGVNAALLMAILLVPVAKQHAYVDELEAELERARATALAAAGLEERVSQLEMELRTLISRKQASPTMVELVNEISKLLPDTTWLQRLEVKNGEAHLRGVSSAATSLIAVIEGSNMFEEVRFRSPVTRDRATGGERFYVSARIIAREQTGDSESDG